MEINAKWVSVYDEVFHFQSSRKDLEPSCKTYLDFCKWF